jgi:hypothetical protein
MSSSGRNQTDLGAGFALSVKIEALVSPDLRGFARPFPGLQA